MVEERVRRENPRDGSMRGTQHDFAVFEDGGRRLGVWEGGQVRNAGKPKKTDSLQEPSERNATLLTPRF